MGGQRDISISLRNGALSGMLYQADGAEAGVILLDGVGTALPEVTALYEELAGYLQGSGVTVLRAGYRQPRDLVTCTYDVLGALDAVHAWGVERAALIVWAFADSNVLETAEGAVTDVATAAVARSVGGDRGPVCGIATIVSPSAVSHGARISRGQLHLVPSAGQSAAGLKPAGAAAAAAAAATLSVRAVDGRHLAIALAGEPDLRGMAAPLLSRLYLWSRQVLLGTAAPSGLAAESLPAVLSSEEPSASREHTLHLRTVLDSIDELLGDDWEALLERLAERDPARAAHVQASLRALEPSSELSMFRRADHVWLYLDYEARQEWLHACTAIRALVTAACRPAEHPA
jgi:hypothetical protein